MPVTTFCRWVLSWDIDGSVSIPRYSRAVAHRVKMTVARPDGVRTNRNTARRALLDQTLSLPIQIGPPFITVTGTTRNQWAEHGKE